MPQDGPIDMLMNAVHQRVEAWKVHWLRVEDVASTLAAQEPEVKAWLTDRYSLTDLKLLLRAVLTPATSDPSERRAAVDGKPASRPA